jgi:two-component system LytT family response regulator
MKKIKIIIVDDERLAREELRTMLGYYDDVEIVSEAANADDAKLLIQEHQPQLIFLDVQMPEKSGFDLLEMLDSVPEIIFTTAFDQYAVKAFEADALDYLVKPIRDERFAKAMEKARVKLNTTTDNRQIFIKDGGKCYLLKVNEIHLIESMDNYAVLYFGDKKTFLKRSLNLMEERLDAATFFRVNRAQIINQNYIDQISHLPGGKLSISLKTGQVVEVSERQSVKFKGKLKA